MSIAIVLRADSKFDAVGPHAISVQRQDYGHVTHIVVSTTEPSGSALGRSVLTVGPAGIVSLLERLAPEVVAICEPGDCFASADVLSAVMSVFSAQPEVDVVYGHASLVDGEGRFLRKMFVDPNADRIGHALQQGPVLARPAVFWRLRALPLSEPLFMEREAVADYDLWTRLATNGSRWAFLDRELARIRTTRGQPRELDAAVLESQAVLSGKRFGYVHWRWLDAITRTRTPVGDGYPAALATVVGRLVPPEARQALGRLAGEGARATRAFLDERLPIASTSSGPAAAAGATVATAVPSGVGDRSALPAVDPLSPLANAWPRLLILDHTRMGDGTATGEIKETLFGNWPRDRIMQVYQPSRQNVAVFHRGIDKRFVVSPNDMPVNLSDAIIAFAPEVILYRPVPETPALHPVAMRLVEELRRPVITWIMDDWPARLARDGLEPELEPDFRRLVAQAAVNLSISDAMSEAFEKRYGARFFAVANAIDPAEWPERLATSGQGFLLRYSGSLAPNMGLESVLRVARAVESLGRQGVSIRFEINTRKYWLDRCSAELSKFSYTIAGSETLSRADYRLWMQTADCNLIAYNFDSASLDYVRYSMANKLPECLVSGVALLAHGPAEVATIAYLKDIGCGFVLSEPSDDSMVDLLRGIVHDAEGRHASARYARQLALERHDLVISRSRLRELIAKAAQQKVGKPERGVPVGMAGPAKRGTVASQSLERQEDVRFDEAAFAHALLARRSGVIVSIGAQKDTSRAPAIYDDWTTIALTVEPEAGSGGRLAPRIDLRSSVAKRADAVSEMAGRRAPSPASGSDNDAGGANQVSDTQERMAETGAAGLSEIVDRHGLSQIDLLTIDVNVHGMSMLRGFPWERLRPEIVMVDFDDRRSRPLGFGMADLATFLRLKGYAILASEWYATEQHGAGRAWRRITSSLETVDPRGCGKLVAIAGEAPLLDVVAAIRRSWQGVLTVEPEIMVQTHNVPKIRSAEPDSRLSGASSAPSGSASGNAGSIAPAGGTVPNASQPVPAVPLAKGLGADVDLASRRLGLAVQPEMAPPPEGAAAPDAGQGVGPGKVAVLPQDEALHTDGPTAPVEKLERVTNRDYESASRLARTAGLLGASAVAAGVLAAVPVVAVPAMLMATVSAVAALGAVGFGGAAFASRQIGRRAGTLEARLEARLSALAEESRVRLAEAGAGAARVEQALAAERQRRAADMSDLERQLARDLADGRKGGEAIVAQQLGAARSAAAGDLAALRDSLERRMAQLAPADRLEKLEQADRDLRQQLGAFEAGLRAGREAERRRVAELMAEFAAFREALEARVAALDPSTALAGLAARLDDLDAARKEMAGQADVEALAAQQEAERQRVADLMAEIAALREALEARVAALDPSTALAGLAARLDDLDAARKDLAGQADVEALAARQETERQRLRQDVEALVERLERLATEQQGLAAASDLSSLAGRLEQLAKVKDDIAPIAQALAGVRSAVEALSKSGQALGERVQSLEPDVARTKAALGEAEAARQAEQEALRQRLSELRAELGALHQRYGGLDDLTQRLEAGDTELRQRLERLVGDLATIDKSLSTLRSQSVSLDLVSALRSLRLIWLQKSSPRTMEETVGAEHGHALLMAVLAEEERKSPGILAGRTLIEIGTTREQLPDQRSTEKLAIFTAMNDMNFRTVDMDPHNTQRARNVLKHVNPSAKAITMKGEDYLTINEADIDYIYLDAFDFYHDNHSQQRKDRYRQLLNTEISDPECWKMHAECAQAIVARMRPGGIVVLDDTWVDETGAYAGKGKLAVPILLDGGFEVIASTRTAVALRRPAQPDVAPDGGSTGRAAARKGRSPARRPKARTRAS